MWCLNEDGPQSRLIVFPVQRYTIAYCFVFLDVTLQLHDNTWNLAVNNYMPVNKVYFSVKEVSVFSLTWRPVVLPGTHAPLENFLNE